MGDINIDLKWNSSLKSEYLHMIESNVFSSLITQPTRVTAGSQMIIDHLLTNDTESVITPGVFLYKLADHYASYCSISSYNVKHTKNRKSTYTFRNIHSDAVDGKSKSKSNLHYTRRITPKRVTSCGAHFRGLAPGQHSSEETSQRWRVVGDTVSI